MHTRRTLAATLAAIAFGLPAAVPVAPATAQHAPQMPDSLPETNQALFAPLALPTPDGVRDASGRPGPDYWQQRADYSIQVSLDPETHSITGSEVITYTNHSSDALDFVWVQLDGNLFRPGSRGSIMNASSHFFGSTSGGVELTRVAVVRGDEAAGATYVVDDTRMRIDLPEPLPARGGTVQLAIDWSWPIPTSPMRTGRLETDDGWIYEVAQWYPRMAVYDDVSGWNPLPYLGLGEFYLEYGDFDVEITVPHDYIVAATGELQNADEVLTAEQRARLDEARGSAETVMVIAPDEVGAPDTRPEGDGPITWRYHAERVRDFAWAASRAFVWDAAGWEDVLIMSVYPREAIGPDEDGDPGWEMSTEFARHTISYYSQQWFRYPYPVAINVGGIVGGMEYPMIVFCSSQARGRSLFGVTDHEFGHSWFPMIVGSDERRYPWMDEGFNTFINHYSVLAYYGDGGEASRSGRTGPESVIRMMQGPISDQPIMTFADVLRPMGLGFMGYSKPGYGLVILREVVLGPERFDEAFRAYVERWAFRHPQPADFFRTMEDISGEDLDWFWRGWFYSTELLDQAVDEVTVEEGLTSVHLSNRQGLVMPTTLDIVFADGTSQRRKLPVEMWIASDTYALPLGETPAVASVTLDPEGILPDVDRSNDTWPTLPPDSD
jgi:hypothetical protein